MYVQFDTLKCKKTLTHRGFSVCQAEALVCSISECDFRNIYDKSETNTMLSDTVEKVFIEERRQREEASREFDRRIALYEKKLEQDSEKSEKKRDAMRVELRNEIRSGIRWVISTIITVSLAVVGYLSALFHYTH